MDILGGKPFIDAVPSRMESGEPTPPCPHKSAHGSSLDCAACEVKLLSVCSALKPDEFIALERMGRTISAPARATLFEQSRNADFVSNLSVGALRLSKLLPDGRRQVVGFALPGDFLGLALAPTHMFTADALTPVKVCQFPRVAFCELLDAKPHLLKRLMAMASHELTLAQDQMVILGRRTAEEKVAAFLIGMRDRYAKLNGHCLHVPLPMTRLDIGDFLGLTVETVSRMMTRLAREKTIVIVPDGVRLLDVARLERIAEV